MSNAYDKKKAYRTFLEYQRRFPSTSALDMSYYYRFDTKTYNFDNKQYIYSKVMWAN